MRTELKLACAIPMALAVASPAQAVVIDFDAGVTGASYSEAGVTFTPIGGGVFSTGYGPTPNATFGLIVDTLVPIEATIAGGASFVSVDLGDFNADPDDLFLRAYDAFDGFLGEDTITIDASFSGLVTLSVSFANIARVEFGGVGANGDSNVYADNFTFEGGAGAIPEPMTWAMMIAGLALSGAAMRRRSTAVRFA